MSYNINFNNSISREPSEVSRTEDYGNTNTGFFSTCADALRSTVNILKEGFFVRYVPFKNDETQATQAVAKKSSHRVQVNKTAVVMMVGILVISAFSLCAASSPQPLSEKHYVQFNNPFVVESEYCLLEQKPLIKSPTEAYLEKYPLELIGKTYKAYLEGEGRDYVRQLETEYQKTKNPEIKNRISLMKMQGESLKEMISLLKNEKLLNEIIESEKEAIANYYVVYRGVNGKQRLPSDTFKALEENSKNITLPKDFMFLSPNATYQNAKEFLDQHYPSFTISDQRLMLFSNKPTPYSDEAVSLAWGLVSGQIPGIDSPIVKRNKAELVTIARDFPWMKNDHFESDDACLNKWIRMQRLIGRLAFNGPEDVKEGLEYGGKVITREEERLAHRWIKLRGCPEYQKALDHFKFKITNPGSDLNAETKPHVISVNLSFLGACLKDSSTLEKQSVEQNAAECTPMYWISKAAGPNGWQPKEQLRKAALEVVLMKYGIPLKEIQTLENIYKDLKEEDDQLLLQILIPKTSKSGENLADKIFYPSLAHGRPLEFYDQIPSSQVLEKYSSNSKEVMKFAQIQGRVVITPEILNPESGILVKIFYLKTPPEERINAYLDKINTWAEGFFS
jgi:hypothetical protein